MEYMKGRVSSALHLEDLLTRRSRFDRRETARSRYGDGGRRSLLAEQKPGVEETSGCGLAPAVLGSGVCAEESISIADRSDRISQGA